MSLRIFHRLRRLPRALAPMLLALPLAACVGGGNARPAEVASYDFGLAGSAPAAASTPATGLPLRGIEVVAPSWLGTPAMHYRLAYADAARRRSYAEARWAAAPAELLESALRRRLGERGSEGGAGCRLRIELDEFVQVFDTPEASRAVVEARVHLLAGSGAPPLGRRVLRLSRPAPSADARGGVAAYGELLGDVDHDLAGWLGALVRATPGLAERCRSGA